MALKGKNNIAYIDGANLHNGVKQLDWKLDYKRFRIWLREKYGVKQAFLFIGLIPEYNDLYNELKKYGYTLIFKKVVYDNKGKPKGNCDTDLVVQAMQDVCANSFEKAILISSDGDYAPLVKYLAEKDRFEVVISPYETKKCSILLKKLNVKISYINEQESILSHRKKAPNTDGTV